MKKVMIGVLILIPVLILLIVAAVTNILSLAAWIAVDDLTLIDKSTKQVAESLTVEFPSDELTHNFFDFIKVEVKPERANRYTLEWSLSDIECMDEDYEAKYEYYLEHKDDPNLPEVKPPAMLIDRAENETDTVFDNSVCKFVINSYCRFNVIVRAESVSKTFSVIAEGYDVESIKIVRVGEEGENTTVKVGESVRLDPKYTPLSSIVTKNIWHSDNPSVVSVDENGVITAHSVGSANITVEANKHKPETEFVTSEAYTVTVEENVSKFGTTVNTAKKTFTLGDLGVNKDDVTSFEGCIIDGNNVTMTSGVAKIVTNKGELTINASTAGAISIANSELFDASTGYVFAVSDLVLKLDAVWTDDLEEGTPDGVSWTSSNIDVATVTDGTVKALSSGLVQITATRSGQSVTMLLNVQIKVVSMQMRTSNDSLAVGLAQETVFATEKYVNIEEGTDKVANSLLIEIVGSPVKGENETDEAYATRLAVFYNAYKFELLGDGSEFASFDSRVENRLVFNPAAYEGIGKKTITVKISAKYPKYDSTTKFTQATLDITAIYGVEVSSFKELRYATDYQKEYVYAEDNYSEAKLAWEHFNTSNGRNDRYRVYDDATSEKTYAITFAEDIPFLEDRWNGDDRSVYIYGDLYGNGHRLFAETDLLDKYNPMVRISWSNVTVSNINIRANDIDESGTITSDETAGFKGQCIYIASSEDGNRQRVRNARIEYSILENACRAVEFINSEGTLEGIIARNISNVAFYARTTMRTYEQEDGIKTTYPFFSHIELINSVFSECLASISYMGCEHNIYMPKKSESDNLYDDYDDKSVSGGVGRFVRNDLQANERYFKEHFEANGICSKITQKGFLDIYNWQNINNANLIGDLGNENLNIIVSAASGSLLKENKTFASALAIGKDETFFHMGFLLSGIDFSNGIFGERPSVILSMEDKRFGSPIRTLNMPKQCTDYKGQLAENVLATADLRYYSYSTSSDIKPECGYVLNSTMIAHLHGEADYTPIPGLFAQ